MSTRINNEQPNAPSITDSVKKV